MISVENVKHFMESTGSHVHLKATSVAVFFCEKRHLSWSGNKLNILLIREWTFE